MSLSNSALPGGHVCRSRLARAGLVLAVFAVVLSITGLQRAWFAGEPAYRGRTVTEWLDQLVLYDDQKDATGTTTVPRAPDRVAHDPALKALLRIGQKATPVLVERLQERAQWDRNEGSMPRMRLWIRWLWNRVRHDVRAKLQPRTSGPSSSGEGKMRRLLPCWHWAPTPTPDSVA